jgi:hypothetical protein
MKRAMDAAIPAVKRSNPNPQDHFDRGAASAALFCFSQSPGAFPRRFAPEAPVGVDFFGKSRKFWAEFELFGLEPEVCGFGHQILMSVRERLQSSPSGVANQPP